jgi:hypothetical protein
MSESLARTSAGTRLYVSAVLPVNQNKAGYEALTWSEVGEITNVGEFGKQYDVVTHTPIGERKTFKRKGLYNQGNMALQMAKAPTDAGQVVCIASLDEDVPIAWKIRYEQSKDEQGRLLYFITYDGGTAEFNVGDTLEGDVSEATSLIVGVDVTEAATPGGDGEGVLAVVNITGAFDEVGETIADDNDIAPGSADFVSIRKGCDEADYMVGMVMSYTTNIGSGSQILGSSCAIEIDGDVVEVAADVNFD